MKRNPKRLLLTIISFLLAFLLLIAVVIGIISSKNVKAMNHCIDAFLTKLQENHTLTPRDTGEYKQLRIYGIMKFDVEQYDIEDIGNLSVMRVNMGVMQMATVVITPQDKNLPLLSADYMYILSNRKAYLEFYDVVAQKDEPYMTLLDGLAAVHQDYEHLKDITTSEAWYQHLLTVTAYKGGNAKADKDLENMLVDSLHVYLTRSKDFPLLTAEERVEKLAITEEYTDGLIAKGGISTDVFKKDLGDEETKKFFDQVFFGTAAQ